MLPQICLIYPQILLILLQIPVILLLILLILQIFLIHVQILLAILTLLPGVTKLISDFPFIRTRHCRLSNGEARGVDVGCENCTHRKFKQTQLQN